MPTASDLVTDLPADFEVFGQAVATSMADLLGGTTGQILAKNSATDMDFIWITNDVGDITAVNTTAPLAGGGTSGALTLSIAAATTAVVGAVQLSDSTSTTSSILAATPTAVKSAYDLANAAIAKSTVTTAGDIIYRNATVPVRLGIGTAGQVLKVNSGATAPEWGTASAGALTLITTNTFAAVSSVSLPTSTFTSTYTNYKIIFIVSTSSTNTSVNARYRASGTDETGSTHYSALSIARTDGSAATQTNINGGTFFTFGHMSTGTPGTFGLSFDFLSPQAAAKKQIVGTGFGYNAGQDGFAAYSFGGFINSTSQFDSFSFITSGGTITGSYAVYGYSK